MYHGYGLRAYFSAITIKLDERVLVFLSIIEVFATKRPAAGFQRAIALVLTV